MLLRSELVFRWWSALVRVWCFFVLGEISPEIPLEGWIQRRMDWMWGLWKDVGWTTTLLWPLSASVCWNHQWINKVWFPARAWRKIPDASGALSVRQTVDMGWKSIAFVHHYFQYCGKVPGPGGKPDIPQSLSQRPLAQRAWTAASTGPGLPQEASLLGPTALFPAGWERTVPPVVPGKLGASPRSSVKRSQPARQLGSDAQKMHFFLSGQFLRPAEAQPPDWFQEAKKPWSHLRAQQLEGKSNQNQAE